MQIIIAVLTKDALDSFQVLLELAPVGDSTDVDPITGPESNLKTFRSVRKSHGMRWDHEECWCDFEREYRKTA